MITLTTGQVKWRLWL